MSKKTVDPGNMPKVWDLMVQLHTERPEAFSNPAILKRIASERWKSLKDEDRCPNCKASMRSYRFEFDMPNASMLIAMARVIRENMKHVPTFTEANKVHVQSMPNPTYAMKSRTTQMAKLGLIAPFLKNKKHVAGTWVITARGWDALANIPVQKWVESFRNKITERSEELVTIKEVFETWRSASKKHMLRGKKHNDYAPDIREYEQHNDWVHFAEIQQGLFL